MDFYDHIVNADGPLQEVDEMIGMARAINKRLSDEALRGVPGLGRMFAMNNAGSTVRYLLELRQQLVQMGHTDA